MKNWIKNITLITLLAIAGISRAQTYPVQSTVVLTPPYSSYLPDYSDPLNNQMRILLTLTDFSIPSYDVKLRFSITGPNNSFSMVSVDPINLPIITLTPGIPTEISGSDLSVYLNPDNLIFQGLDKNDYIQNQLIPEGLTQICVEVIDPNSVNGTVIGNPACGQNWFSKLNPPQLMSPNCGASLTPFDPQAILFNWTPANFTSNGQTEFVFELYHMIPDQYDGSLPDPNLWVSQANPIFSDSNIFVPVYNYGIGSFPTPMILQLGQTYCWRVQAKDQSGRDYYHNKGWSNVCTFTYGSVEEALLDGIELDLNSNGTGKRQGTAWWNVSGTLDSYVLELRKTGNASYEWFPYPTTEGDLKLNSLEPETEYECRVKGLLGNIETDYSNVSTFTTLPPAEYACGETTLPAVSPNVVPLNFLQQGMFVSVGQFEMEVMAAEPDGAAGHFKGYGKIQIPFMLLALNVEFEDLFIDENMTVVDGQVDAITQGVEAWVESFNKEFITGTISNIDFEEGDSIVTVYLADGTAHTYDMPNNGPLVFEDETGLIWTVNPDGTITVTGDLNWDDEVLEATAGHQIYFKAHEDQLFGFDDYRYTLWSEQYPVIKLLDNSMYFVPWKSVGESYEDKIYAVVVDSSGNAINNPTFVDQDGTVFPATSVGNKTWEVTIPAGMPINKKVLAYDDEGKKVGKFNLLKYASREVDVVVVPINNATIPANLQTEVNEIFSQAYTVFSFSEQPDWNYTFDVDSDGLDCANPDGMELYSAEMKAIRTAYFEAFDTATTEAHYIFVVPGFENASQQGYNVGGKSMSFVKGGVSTRVYAHELGHGTNLEHTFPTLPKGTTNNLMDYVDSDTALHLTALQWEAIQDYHLLFSFLDNEEDGAAFGIADFSNLEVTALDLNLDHSCTNSDYFILKTGQLVKIEKSAEMTREAWSGNLQRLNFNGVPSQKDGKYLLAVSVHHKEGLVTKKANNSFFVNLEGITESECRTVLNFDDNQDFQRKLVSDHGNDRYVYRNIPGNRKYTPEFVECVEGIIVLDYNYNGKSHCKELTDQDCELLNTSSEGEGGGLISLIDKVVLYEIKEYDEQVGNNFGRLLPNGKAIDLSNIQNVYARKYLLGYESLGSVYRLAYVEKGELLLPIGYINYASYIGLSEGSLDPILVQNLTDEMWIKFDEFQGNTASNGKEVHYRIYDGWDCFIEYSFIHDDREKYVEDEIGFNNTDPVIYQNATCQGQILAEAICESLQMAGEGIEGLMDLVWDRASIPEEYWNPENGNYEDWVYDLFGFVSPGNFIIEPIIGKEASQIQFAFLCGLYNGVVREFTETVKIIPLFFEYVCNAQTRSAINEALAGLDWEKVKLIVEEDFTDLNNFQTAEMSARYLVAAATVVIPILKANWLTKIGKFGLKILKLPKKAIKLITKIKKGKISQLYFSKGEQILKMSSNQRALGKFDDEGVFKIFNSSDIVDEFGFDDIIDDFGEIKYTIEETGEVIQGQVVLIEKSGGEVAFGLVTSTVNAVIGSLDLILGGQKFGRIFEKLQHLKNTKPTNLRSLNYENLESFRDALLNRYISNNGLNIKEIEDFLDDLETFIETYATENIDQIENIEHLFDEMLQSVPKFRGGAFALEFFKDLPEELANLILDGFEIGAEEGGRFRVDIQFLNTQTLKTVFVELKNYAKNTPFSSSFLNQFKNYINVIDDFEELLYVFRANTDVTRDFIVDKFRKMISKNSPAIFDANPELFKQFTNFENTGLIDTAEDLKNLMDSKNIPNSHEIFDFIKTL